MMPLYLVALHKSVSMGQQNITFFELQFCCTFLNFLSIFVPLTLFKCLPTCLTDVV